MRERINRLAKGIVDAAHEKLVIKPQSVKEKVQAGKLAAGELYIADREGRFVKGLVYSSNIRVRVKNEAFGGARNRVFYEIDSRYLTGGDVVEGVFSLVTDAGEYQIPYTFLAELGPSAQLLGGLKTAEDFATAAKADPEKALRLFEYRDFPEAPFMHDLHIRALYDGLKGRPDRRNAMEEFLVALSVKEPVELRMDTAFRSISISGEQPAEEILEVRCSTWGYARFTVRADGDFIELSRTSYGPEDFSDGVCRVTYRIVPSRLHAGRNLGALILSDVRESRTLRLEAVGKDKEGARAARRREDYSRLFKLRVEYETGLYGDRLLLNQMKQELENLRSTHGENRLHTLIDAELCLLDGKKEQASVLLESCRGEMAEHRQEWYVEYCYYTYLRILLSEREGQRESLKRLITKYLDETPSGCLFALLLKLEPEKMEDAAGILEEARQMFGRGCRSPFLYAAVCKLYLEQPGLLLRMDELELQAMMFAARQELLSHDLALRIAELAASARRYRRLYCRLLIMLYDKYEEKPFLAAVCGMLIRGDCRDSKYFPWYEKALAQKIGLTRLYEYYLYALPQDYAYLMPKEVLLYFSYEKSLDDYSRSVLYTNILKYMKPDAPIYQQYERDIEQFTMDQLLKSRINRRLVVLYQHMIYREMIDEKVARVLPAILKSFRVRLKNPNMKYVIVCYEELEGEDAFPIRDGVAYVPLFLDRSVLLFQDEYGNRYANISYRKSPAMDKEEIRDLEERCYEVYPAHPMLRMQECSEIVGAGIESASDAETLRRAVMTLPLRDLYREQILSRIIRYHRAGVERRDSEGDVGYLLGLDPDAMAREDRAAVCEALIARQYQKEAWEMICKYGTEGISEEYLLSVCSWMILRQISGADDEVLAVCVHLFENGRADSVILDYLCEHFNGASDQMYRILEQGKKNHVEIYDLPERLLAQMIFSGTDGPMDQVFDWYASGKRTGDSLMKAYFTLKSADYFLRERPAGERVFAWLEGAVRGAAVLNRVPTVYLLALCRHYADQTALDEDQKRLCRDMVKLQVSEGRVFAWMKRLGRLVPMPDSVMDKAIVEYRGSAETEPAVEVRILPEETEFHTDRLHRVYAGIYVLQKVLFDGETLEYRITGHPSDDSSPDVTGSIEGGADTDAAGESRFTALNEMVRCFADRDEAALKDKMKQYLTDYTAMEDLFPLM